MAQLRHFLSAAHKVIHNRIVAAVDSKNCWRYGGNTTDVASYLHRDGDVALRWETTGKRARRGSSASRT